MKRHRISGVPVCAHCLVSCHWEPLRCLASLSLLSSHQGFPHLRHPWAFLSPDWAVPSLSVQSLPAPILLNIFGVSSTRKSQTHWSECSEGPKRQLLRTLFYLSSWLLEHTNAAPKLIGLQSLFFVLWPLSSSGVIQLATLTMQGVFQGWLSKQTSSEWPSRHSFGAGVLLVATLYLNLIMASEIFLRRTCYCFHFIVIQRLRYSLAGKFCAVLAEWHHIVWMPVMTKECSWLLFFIWHKSSFESSRS